MATDLAAHPRTVRIMSALCADKFRVVGGLHAVWCVFDAHTESGKLDGYTLENMDAVIGWSGFSSAMRDAGWLIDHGGACLEMPSFTRHNGVSAKRRAMDSERKRASRICPQNVRKMSAKCHTKTVTREEERRGEKSVLKEEKEKVSADESAPSTELALIGEIEPEPNHAQMSDAQWLASISSNDCYSHCSVTAEHAKMVLWCNAHRKQPTRRRFLGWLNRIERPMQSPSKSQWVANAQKQGF